MGWDDVVKVMALNAAIVHESEAAAANAARARIKELEGQLDVALNKLSNALGRLDAAADEIDSLKRKGNS